MKRACIVLLCGVVGVVGAGVASASDAADSTNVAVINLSVVFDRYRLTKDLEAKFTTRQRQMEGEAQKQRDEIEVKRQALASFKPGTDDYDTRRDEITKMVIEYQIRTEVKKEQLRESHKQWLLKIYQDVRGAVAAVAKEDGVDLVLTYEEVTADAPDSKALRQQLLLEKVFYFGEKLDLTEKVISRVNADYAGPESIQLGAAGPGAQGGADRVRPVAEAKAP
ncbi:MAG: OmpH family outer membrane protein [Phycisphaerales bacterium]|nr:MAG: OmpH family outer membrane protein [Phycisphaerales bacterium]